MTLIRNNVSNLTFQEYLNRKKIQYKNKGIVVSSSNIRFLKYPYITSVNNAIIRGENVPRSNQENAFILKYQFTLI